MKITKKFIIIISATGLSIAAVSLLWQVKRRQSATPNPARQKPEQIAEYFRSDEFRNLDPNERRSYIREAMRQRMAQNVKEYCKLEPEERIAYLDKVIDTMQSRRREFGARRREFESRGEQDQRPHNDRQRNDRRRGRRRRNPEDMRARRESITPETGEFSRALRQRMQEQGINSRHGRGRGPRG